MTEQREGCNPAPEPVSPCLVVLLKAVAICGVLVLTWLGTARPFEEIITATPNLTSLLRSLGTGIAEVAVAALWPAVVVFFLVSYREAIVELLSRLENFELPFGKAAMRKPEPFEPATGSDEPPATPPTPDSDQAKDGTDEAKMKEIATRVTEDTFADVMVRALWKYGTHSFAWFREHTKLQLSDEEFLDIVKNRPRTFELVRIIDRDADGNRVIPGKKGVRLSPSMQGYLSGYFGERPKG